MTNHNRLLRAVPGCIGMKTGYTRAAGRTLVSAAERDGRRLVAVTLQDGNDWADMPPCTTGVLPRRPGRRRLH